MGRAELPDGSRVSITRAWALHRALRTPWEVSRFGEVVEIPPARLLDSGAADSPARSTPPPPVSAPAGPGGARARLRGEWRKVRGPRSALRFARWLQRAVFRRVIRRLRGSSPEILRPPPPAGRVSAQSPAAACPPGVGIDARGPRSRAVFEASGRVAQAMEGEKADLVVADTAAAAENAPAPAVVLADAPPILSTPAFDPVQHNPVNWPRQHDGTVGALGAPGQLPPGCRADHVVRCDDHEALKAIHHLEDVAAYHADIVARAGVLVRLAAMGVLVHIADADQRLAPYVGAKLFEMMTGGAAGLDAARREMLSIRMRREALREHSRRGRVRQLCAHAGIEPPPLPLVSVLLVTKRPHMLQHALAAVARQTYPRIELVLGLHGEGFADVERQRASFPVPTVVVRVGARQPLGAALNSVAAAATGTLLAKMDDDDAYGREHLWDLVLAQEYAQADCVSKTAEYFFLTELNTTIHRWRGSSEKPGERGGGSSILATRTAFTRAGGFPCARTAEDVGLMERIRESGGRLYRTHGAGYVPVRHNTDHSWEVSDDHFIGRADAISFGWDPEESCIEDMAARYMPTEIVEDSARKSARSVLKWLTSTTILQAAR